MKSWKLTIQIPCQYLLVGLWRKVILKFKIRGFSFKNAPKRTTELIQGWNSHQKSIMPTIMSDKKFDKNFSMRRIPSNSNEFFRIGRVWKWLCLNWYGVRIETSKIYHSSSKPICWLVFVESCLFQNSGRDYFFRTCLQIFYRNSFFT